MPSSYRAGPGSGLFGAYAQPNTRPQVDIGGAIDAIGNSASNLIAQAYQRKLTTHQLARQDAIDQRAAAQQQWERGQAEQKFAFDKSQAAIANERETAQALAALGREGYVEAPDGGDGSLTASAYGAAPVTSTAPAAAPIQTNPLASVPGYQAKNPGPSLLDAYASPTQSAPVATAAPVPPSPPQAALTMGGKRYIRDYKRSDAAQAESQRETFEKSQTQLTQTFQEQMQKARAGDERALENLRFMHEQNLIPTKAKAEAEAFLTKQQFGTPNQDETTAAIQLPEMIKSHQILQDLGKPELTTTLTQKHGGSLAKAIQSPDGQRFLQAAKQFSITGTLATEGARFSPEKQKASDDMFIPSNWNDPSALAQISNSRKQRILDAATKSGRAFNNLPLDTQQYLVDSLGYKPVRGQFYSAPGGGATATPPAAGTDPGGNIDLRDTTPSPRRVGRPVTKPVAGGGATAAPANPYVSKYGITP